jgi:hypothetical protein
MNTVNVWLAGHSLFSSPGKGRFFVAIPWWYIKEVGTCPTIFELYFLGFIFLLQNLIRSIHWRPQSRVYTEWQLEKSALAGEVGGARPPPFTLSTITYKVAVHPPAERAGTHRTLPVNSSLPYMYSALETYGCVVRIISGSARPLAFTS